LSTQNQSLSHGPSPEEQAQIDQFELESKIHARKIRFKAGDVRILNIKSFVGQQPNETYVGKIDWIFEAADINLNPVIFKPWPTTITTARKVMEHFKAGRKTLRIERKGSGMKDTDYKVEPVSNN
jgi:hypothetical protein